MSCECSNNGLNNRCLSKHLWKDKHKSYIECSIKHLAILEFNWVNCVERMKLVGPWLWIKSYELFVHQSHLERIRWQLTIWLLLFRYTSIVVHMIVQVNEFRSQGSEDLQVTPKAQRLAQKMHFHHYLINIVQILYREMPESSKLSSLSVDLENDMLFLQILRLDKFLQWKKDALLKSSSHWIHANWIKSI